MPEIEFETGQLVHHKRYGYRGVIVSVDPECRASESWYEGNKTQPGRDQAWYHVLVDGASHTTYVAQSNLEPDTLGARVKHPLLSRFFRTFFEGRYYKESLN